MKQKVLLVGGGGFIGLHLARHLVKNGFTVHATYRPGGNPPSVSDIQWHPTDLSSSECTSHWPRDCQQIVYLAQSRSWRDFPKGVSDVTAVNIQALVQAALFAKSINASRFIYLSTGTVYSQTSHPARESDPIDFQSASSFYAASKIAGEALLAPFSQSFPIVTLRLFMPYGPGQSDKLLLSRIIRSVRERLPIYLHGKDGLLTNPIAVHDVVESICRCLKLDKSCALNVAGPDVLTLRSIAEIVGSRLAVDPIFEEKAHLSPPVIVGDLDKLESTLGWKPTVRFAQGVSPLLRTDGDNFLAA